MHKLLQRQLRQAQRASTDGSVDLEELLRLVDAAYGEIDRERRFTAHAHTVLRDEYALLTEKQLQIHTAMAQVKAEKAEAERARAAAEAEVLKQERLSLLGRLTASMAHELRNPLSTIRNTVHTIQEMATGKGFDFGRPMERIHRTIDRCDTIIRDLLDYAGTRDVVVSPIRLDPWLDAVLDGQTVPPEIEIERNFGAPEAIVTLDAERIRVVLVNLFKNAIEALAEAPDPSRRRVVVTTHVDDSIEIAIADTGPGIPEEMLSQVFEPLFSTRGFGTGLGLATAKQIVEQHGGSIAIGNVTGAGARVVIRLPFVAAQSAAA
jgi:signal transduction histidine kinase